MATDRPSDLRLLGVGLQAMTIVEKIGPHAGNGGEDCSTPGRRALATDRRMVDASGVRFIWCYACDHWAPLVRLPVAVLDGGAPSVGRRLAAGRR